MEQKINEKNIENNLVLCIDPRKAFAIKSIPRSVFRNPSHKNKQVGLWKALTVLYALNICCCVKTGIYQAKFSTY